MNGYLLDNNAIFRWHGGHPRIIAHVNGLPKDTPVHASVVTLGEIRFGYAINPATDQQKRDEFERWFSCTFPALLEITRHTTEYYGEIRAILFRTYPRKGKGENHPEMCCDPVTGKELGIDENDLWLAAQARSRITSSLLPMTR